MSDKIRNADGTVARHTWCLTHNQPTTQWPGTWGQRCAWSQNDCITEYREGVVKRIGAET